MKSYRIIIRDSASLEIKKDVEVECSSLDEAEQLAKNYEADLSKIKPIRYYYRSIVDPDCKKRVGDEINNLHRQQEVITEAIVDLAMTCDPVGVDTINDILYEEFDKVNDLINEIMNAL